MSKTRKLTVHDVTPPEDAVNYLAHALKPIIGVMMERVVGVGEWQEAIRIAAYMAAYESTEAEAGRAVFSRMSVRTGLSRTELTQIRKRILLGAEQRRSIGRTDRCE